MLTVADQWEAVLTGEACSAFEMLLPDVLRARRWFGGKARHILSAHIVESIPVPFQSVHAVLLQIRLEYGSGSPEMYALPITAAFHGEASLIERDLPHAVVAPLAVQRKDQLLKGLLYDALWNQDFARAILDAIGHEVRFVGRAGSLQASSTGAFAGLVSADVPLVPAVVNAEQSNTSVAYSGRVMLKLYRRLVPGINPDLEVGRALTAMKFPYSAPVAGAIEYHQGSAEPMTVALAQGFIRNDGDAWQHSLNALDRYFMRVTIDARRAQPAPHAQKPLLELAQEEYPAAARELIGLHLQSAERLGQRTAELHLALSQIPDDPAFSPEPLDATYREARHGAMIQLSRSTLAFLQEREGCLSAERQILARRLIDHASLIEAKFAAFRELRALVQRIRCHGDYHLGQVLCAGSDFVIIDFEGEPARPLEARRMKHPAMLDVAGMVRSFHYAAFAYLEGKRSNIAVASQEWPVHRESWARFWSDWTGAAFLKSYLRLMAHSQAWPQTREEERCLFEVYLLEKAMYELNYELNNRPDWVEIPLKGIMRILEPAQGVEGHHSA